jgi:hypothetical protein
MTFKPTWGKPHDETDLPSVQDVAELVMPDRQLSASERDLLRVIRNETSRALDVSSLTDTNQTLDARIAESEALLISLDMKGDPELARQVTDQTQVMRELALRPFSELLEDALAHHPGELGFEDFFSAAEIDANRDYIRQLNADFDSVHKLDAVDVIIPALAGILSGAVDCALGGFVTAGSGVSAPNSMSLFVNGLFDKALPTATIRKLEDIAKVPYDALNYDNRGNVIVETIVEGLSPIFHHQVSLAHDPILGFIFGTLDMMRGSMTTMDFNGKFVIQAAEGFSDRRAQGVFEALTTVFLHMLSDVNGSSSAKNGGMGLPVPFMALFNKLQFGRVGDIETISELVKSMYYQGYDFRHFCSMSIPAMITEVIVRVSYFAKRLHEGYSIREATPVGLSRTRKPKLATMLFIGHSASTAINAAKVAFTDNPLNINYPQWLAFATYSVKQLRWAVIEKPALRDQYVRSAINDEWGRLSVRLDSLLVEVRCQSDRTIERTV